MALHGESSRLALRWVAMLDNMPVGFGEPGFAARFGSANELDAAVAYLCTAVDYFLNRSESDRQLVQRTSLTAIRALRQAIKDNGSSYSPSILHTIKILLVAEVSRKSRCLQMMIADLRIVPSRLAT